MWRDSPQEQLAFFDPRSTRDDIVTQGVANFLGQIKFLLALRFSTDSNCRPVPVDVCKTHFGKITGSQCHPGQQQNHGPVPKPEWCGAVAGGDDVFNNVA